MSLLLLAVAIPSLMVNAIIIGNDQVVIGVNPQADLNAPYVGGFFGLPLSDPMGIGYIGLRAGAGSFASTEPGCKCEGWGVGTRTSDGTYKLWANQASGDGNMVPVSIVGSNGGSSVVVTTRDSTNNILVVHDYHTTPKSAYAIEVTVTITNIGSSEWPSLRYKRVMDWDISPTEFSEYVTIDGWPADNLYRSHDNGFESADPFVEGPVRLAGTLNVNFEDSGPSDHGASFIFEFTKEGGGSYGNGDSETFNIYYGAAPGEPAAEATLAAIGAEVYSLGQQRGDPTGGSPYTFIFAFNGVGGEVVCPDFVYESAIGAVTREEGQALCQSLHGTDLASFTSQEEMDNCICELVGDGPSPWVQLKGVHPTGFYFEDGTVCPVTEENLCVANEMYCTGFPLGCREPGSSECVYLDSTECCLKNDVSCDDTRTAILCEANSS